MIDTSFLTGLAKYGLVIRKRVTSPFIGQRKSIAQGRGIIFKEHRVYAPGDDFRAIDWKVFARTDDLMVKTFEEERSLVVHLIIDCSKSMNFGKHVTKFEYASMIGVGVAYLAMKENEKFMFSTFSDKLEIFQPRRGMSQLAAMVDHLNSIKPDGVSNFKETLSQYRKIIGSRALVVIVTDLLMKAEDIIEGIYLLGKHDIKIVQVLDPVEKDLRLNGDFKLEDSETKDNMRTFISPSLRVEYQKVLDQHNVRVENACTKLGIGFYSITTDTPIFDAFHKILSSN